MMRQAEIQQPAAAGRPGAARRIVRVLLVAALALVVACLTGWGSLFLYCSNLPGAALRTALAAAFALGTLGLFVFMKRRRVALLVFAVAWAALVAWCFALRPSNDRRWAAPVAVLATATVNGDLVEIKNIRNFDYRSETDFTPRYYDKTFDLRTLESLDVVCVYWGSQAIAHVMVSFGFGGGDFVAFSIEMRNEEGEANSMLRSFFRNYELVYVVADERDVIRVRTNYRDPREQVFVHRTRLPVEDQRKGFLDYIETLNRLAQAPEWYNTIEDNCTTGVLGHASAYRHRARYNWKILLSGYAAEYAYGLGMLDTSLPFAELRDRALVNPRAQAAGQAADFSRRIREGIPLPAPMTMQEFLARD